MMAAGRKKSQQTKEVRPTNNNGNDLHVICKQSAHAIYTSSQLCKTGELR
jgi:hypothetical protein